MVTLCPQGLLLVQAASLCRGHGNMFHPPIWQDRGGYTTHIGCGVLDLPKDTEFSEVRGKDPDCLVWWYSNNVVIPGHATIPGDMAQDEVTCLHQAGHYDDKKEFPWNAPGTAPTFGPCGTMGGNPLGCDGDSTGEFGDCCSHNCDGFALGKNAEEYSWPGEIPVTEWSAGSHQEVSWYVSANHAGGYSYRLCRMPEEGIVRVTEDCFQETPLDFVGDKQWVMYRADHGNDGTGHRTEVAARRTREGTFPHGSQWTANPLWPRYEEGGSSDYSQGQVIDLVKVPEDLEPGEYVLSFRWDCKCSPQVWGSCSNIVIL